jgi:uncharacterized RDD family membrane protein YckC
LAVAIDMALVSLVVEAVKEWVYYAPYGPEGLVNKFLTNAHLNPAGMHVDIYSRIATFEALVAFVCLPYFVIAESSSLQGTLGKYVLGLRVAGLNGQRITLGRAFGRYQARLASVVPFYLGFLMPLVTPKHQGLHDIIAGTLVVHTRKSRRHAICAGCSKPLERSESYCRTCNTPAPWHTVGSPGTPGQRIGAYIVDMAVLALLFLMAASQFFPSLGQILLLDLDKLHPQYTAAEQGAMMYSAFTKVARTFFVLFVAGGVYSVFTTVSAMRGTLGKYAFGLKVTDLYGRPLDVKLAATRYFFQWWSALMWMVGFAMAGFDSRQQAFHDKLAGTLVLRRGDPFEEPLEPVVRVSLADLGSLPAETFPGAKTPPPPHPRPVAERPALSYPAPAPAPATGAVCLDSETLERSSPVWAARDQVPFRPATASEADRRMALRYAGFWRRLFAFYIDYCTVVAPLSFLCIYLFLMQGPEYLIAMKAVSVPVSNEEAAALARFMTALYVKLFAVLFIVWAPYCALMERSSWQATLGKRALGLQVTDRHGRRITQGQAWGRFAARTLSALPLCLGFLSAAFTIEKRALHDYVAGTVVIIADKELPR